VKGLKYKGNKVEVQRVRAKKSPKIEQISQQDADNQHQREEELLRELTNEEKGKAMTPTFEVLACTRPTFYEPYSLDVKSYNSLKVVVNLPHLIHSKGIHLEGSLRLLYLSVRNMYELCLKIPFDIGRVNATFSRKQRKLEVLIYRNTERNEGKEQKENNSAQQTAAKIQIENDLLYDLV
jgi:hypothetical protein